MSRPSVFSFFSYRLWLRRLLQFYVDEHGYDSAQFSAQLKMKNGYLGRLLERAVLLDETAAGSIESGLDLTPAERDYFRVMIGFSHAQNPEEEEAYYRKMMRLRRLREIDAAHRAVLDVDPHWRDISSLTLSVNRTQFRFIKTMLGDLRKSVLQYLADTEEAVFGELDKNEKANPYQLNLQLFQVTQGDWPVAEKEPPS